MEPKDVSKKHFYISLVKSLFRLGACYGLWFYGTDVGSQVLQVTAVFLGIAEVLGIAEEI